MTPRLVAVLVGLLLLPVDADARRRASRGPAGECTYAISSTIVASVADEGLTRGVVHVTPQSAWCSSWLAFSPVGWIAIETDAQTAYITVAPNDSEAARSAVLLIAGVPLPITQSAPSVIVSPPTGSDLLRNGDFDSSLEAWGWPSEFPNSVGDASWTSLDADGSAGSGSIRIRDRLSGDPAFQQSQCVAAAPGDYDYGFAVRAVAPDAVRPVIALVEFDSADCSGNYHRYTVRTPVVKDAAVWQRHNYPGSLRASGRSIMVVIGSYATQSGAQEVWIDDVFLRRR